jgi:hypothetical protein
MRTAETHQSGEHPVHKALPTCLLGLAIALVPAREVRAQSATGSVALIDAFKFSPKATQAHARMRVAIEEALARDGLTVVQGPAGVDCGSTTECLAGVARESGVGYVLRVTGQRRRESEYGYDISVDLYSPVTRQVRGGNWSCGLCDSKGVGELAGKNAIDLLAKTAKEEAEIKQAASGIAPPRAAAPAPIEPAPPALVAVVGMAYGGWALAKDGSSSGSPHLGAQALAGHDAYSSKTLGIGTLVAGGVLAAVGVIWIALPPSRSAALSASPNHVAFSLRF